MELFRSENGGYLYDDGGGEREVCPEDRARTGLEHNGTCVTIVVENPQVNIVRYGSLVQAISRNIYLRDLLLRREVELYSMQQEKVLERSGTIRYVEPPSQLLLGPEVEGNFEYGDKRYPFYLTLKRAEGVELSLKGDQRTNGIVVLSGKAVLDCSLFDYENQVGTEYLFGTVRCPVLIEKLGTGMAIISDEREGLNRKNDLVEAFSHALSRMIEPSVLAEQEKLRHLERATTSDRTARMIEHLLERMSKAATEDLGIYLPSGHPGAESSFALRFSTPFYYRRPGHPFHVSLLIDAKEIGGEETVTFSCNLPDSMRIDPLPSPVGVQSLEGQDRLEWSVVGEKAGEKGEITARAGAFWARCEIVVSEEASRHGGGGYPHPPRSGIPRDHGVAMFSGYEFRHLQNEREGAHYSPDERKIIINTGAPTVQLYVDGRGHFRDTARLLLAELFMDVISDELARHAVEKLGKTGDFDAFHSAKQEIIRRYGSEIHLSFLNAQG